MLSHVEVDFNASLWCSFNSQTEALMQCVCMLKEACILANPYMYVCVLIICTLLLCHAPLTPPGTPILLEPSCQHMLPILLSCLLLYFISVVYMDGGFLLAPGQVTNGSITKTFNNTYEQSIIMVF